MRYGLHSDMPGSVSLAPPGKTAVGFTSTGFGSDSSMNGRLSPA